jgi:hypothetical protein
LIRQLRFLTLHFLDSRAKTINLSSLHLDGIIFIVKVFKSTEDPEWAERRFAIDRWTRNLDGTGSILANELLGVSYTEDGVHMLYVNQHDSNLATVLQGINSLPDELLLDVLKF